MVLVSCEYALRRTGPTVFPGIPVGFLSSTCTDRVVGVGEARVFTATLLLSQCFTLET